MLSIWLWILKILIVSRPDGLFMIKRCTDLWNNTEYVDLGCRLVISTNITFPVPSMLIGVGETEKNLIHPCLQLLDFKQGKSTWKQTAISTVEEGIAGCNDITDKGFSFEKEITFCRIQEAGARRGIPQEEKRRKISLEDSLDWADTYKGMHSKMATAPYNVRRQPIEMRLWEADQPHRRICDCRKGFIPYSLDNGDTDTVQVFS